MSALETDSSQPPRLLRVVVVDEEPEHVMALLAVLRGEGFQAHGYGSGEAALQGIRQIEPDAVVLSLGMPGLDGWQLAREVRKDKPGSRHPLLIAMTDVQPAGADEPMMRAAGFDGHLAKPFDPKRVVEVILQRF